jgi:hypothetical protein
VQAAERVEHGPVEQRRAVGCDEGVQALPGALRELEMVALGEQAKGRVGQPTLPVQVARDAQRCPELFGVVGVRQRGVLVEPLGGEHLGGRPPGLAAVLESDARPHEHLRGLGQGDDAEAKRQAEAHVALEEGDLPNAKLHRAGSPYRSGFFQMSRSCMSRICRRMTFARYSACFIGGRLR